MAASEQLTYEKTAKLYPTYSFVKILPTTGSQTQTITSAGAISNTFEIAKNVINLSRSYLSFVGTPDAGGAGNFLWTWKDVLAPFQRIELSTVGGTRVVDFNNCDYASKIIRKLNTPLTEFLTNPLMSTTTNGEFLQRSNALASAVGSIRADGTSPVINYTNEQNLEVGTAANNQTPVLNARVPLSAFIHSLFEIDKDVAFNEIMQIVFYWNPSGKWYFTSTSGTNPTTGVLGFSGNVTLTNLALFVAVEQNPVIIGAVQQAVNSKEGFQLQYEACWSETQNLTGGSVTMTSKIDPAAKGQALLRVYNTIAAQAIGLNTTYDFSEVTPKITSFQTLIDSKPLQNQLIVLSDRTDYLYQKDRFRGSVIQDLDTFLYNWVWVDSFENPIPYCERWSDYTNEIQGLSLFYNGLPQQIVHDFICSLSSNTYRYYKFIVTQRMLNVSSTGGVQVR